MPDPLVSISLAKDWIPKLWKQWSTIRESRRAELEVIGNLFGNPELLAQSYIEPDCQRLNPADHHEEEPHHTFRQPIRGWLNGFLSGEFFERDGRNTLFVLSDAGMGKSSLLMMLKFSHMLHFWPSELEFRLEKLGPETLATLEGLGNRGKTVLLLDALDEDPTAWGRIEERLAELLHATKSFRQVILTCRTQFFPEGGQTPIETPEKVEVAGFVCNMLYLSPFSDEQVEVYLRKRFPNRWWDWCRKLFSKEDNGRLEEARRLIGPMRSLRMRPMLLAYIDVLMGAGLESLTEYSVYAALVARWLLREEAKTPGGPTREVLLEACSAVAMHLQRTGQRVLTAEGLREVLVEHPDAEHLRNIDVGGRSLLNLTSDRSYRFAHYSIQEFLVAQRLVTDGGEQGGEPLRATDQLLRFLFLWAREGGIGERLRKVPWTRLDCSGIEKLSDYFRGLDLKGLALPRFLRGVDLAGLNLQGADLQGANLRDANLRGADLRGADLRDVDLRDADLRDALLQGAYLTGARYEKHGVEFVWIPGREFLLGEGESEHRVRLSPFWMGKFPVTNAQYRRFLEANPGQEEPKHWHDTKYNEPEQPVVGVSWHEAMAFCRWTGLGLPSEAQWEAAARGPEARAYPWGDTEPAHEFANYERKVGRPTPVDSYPKGVGPFGTLDQAGNVWEWCRDAYDKDAYRGRDGRLDPVVLGEGSVDKSVDNSDVSENFVDKSVDNAAIRVVRGGSWFFLAGSLRSAARFRIVVESRGNGLGFRCVGAVPSEP